MYVCDKFARVHLDADVSSIRPEDRPVLSHIIRASHLLNAIYLRQVSHYNPQFKQEIEDSQSKKLIESYRIMGGPWDRFEDDKPFYGSIEKPLGAGFYPSDLTREEFENWIEKHPEDREAFQSFNTTIRRTADGLAAVPYSQTYPLELEKAAHLLREASAMTDNASLRHFLITRADALLSNDYAESDGAWIHLDSDIEVVFGPYETYEDEIIEDMQQALPISDEMKGTRQQGQSSPFVVIDLLSNAGEARVGVQTLAFVLPNDPAVIEKHGTKKVMMKNVQEAKFNAILRPIAERFLSAHALSHLSFEAFFRHTILHETGHSLGPKSVKNSSETIIHSLSDTYAPIEECKADSTSTFLSDWLRSRGELSDQQIEETCATMLAGFFRSLRFGLAQAHARANAIQLNYLLERGAVFIDENGFYDYRTEPFIKAITDLVTDIMNIEYCGDRDKANEFLAKYATLSNELTDRLKQLGDLPVDIACTFEAEKPDFF